MQRDTPFFSQAPARNAYFPALDGLRGIAILLVFLFHAHASVVPGGWTGVNLFFVLSGYLITSILLKEFDRTGQVSLKNFYMRRVLRLIPALVVFAGAYLILARYNGDPAPKASLAAMLTYTTDWLLAFQLLPLSSLSHTWSLAVEEQFYILWPLLLVWALPRMRRRSMLALTCALAAGSAGLGFALNLAGASPNRTYFAADTHACELLIGCALAVWLSRKAVTERAARLVRTLAPAALAGLVLLFATVPVRSAMVPRGGLVVAAVLSAVLVLCALDSETSKMKRLLGFRPLVALGRISYSVYLWHLPILVLLHHVAMPKIFIVPVGAVLSLSIAAASYRFVEAPFLGLKQRWSKRPDAEPGIEPAPVAATA